VDEHLLGRVFGVFEIGVALTTAAGSVLGSVLVQELGIREALVVSGVILPFLTLLSFPGLRRIDASVEVPERELGLVAEVPLFSLLPPTTMERLAARLEPVRVAAGTMVVEEGEAGDRFYVIASGEIDVIHGGSRVNTLGAGDYFGEIALLRDVPRVATCTARTDAELYSLGRDVFIAAVSGDMRSSTAAESVMGTRLDELQSRPLSSVGDGTRG
jgi:CRP-like cAMP-binding protein